MMLYIDFIQVPKHVYIECWNGIFNIMYSNNKILYFLEKKN